MRSADDMKRLFGQAHLEVHADTDECVFADVLRARQEHQAKSIVALSQWRIAMKSPIAKLTVAATVIIACMMGFFMWSGTQPGVALADVLTRIQQISVYTYQMSMTMTGSTGRVEVNQNIECTTLISEDLGMKMSMEMTDPKTGATVSQKMYMLPKQRKMLTITPEQKMYTQVELDEAMLERQQKQNNDPGAMVKQILECEYRSLGRSTIDGVEVEGFQTTDPKYMGGMMGQTDVVVWVDAKTQLPVRFEMDIQMGDAMHMQGVMHDFHWDVSVDAAEFEPVIPEDYTNPLGGPMKMPAVNEETALEGLRLCAELSGQYPEKLDMMSLMAVMKDIKSNAQLNRDDEDAGMKEMVSDMMETLKPILTVGTFNAMLMADDKDPVYYGKTVTPEDADQVLMRWKISDAEYRVIFGSLHVKTVTKEVLAELERPLSQ